MRTQTRFLIVLAVLAIGGTVLLAQRSEGRHRGTGDTLQPDGTTQIESLTGIVDQTAITGNRPISQPVTVTNFPDPQQVAGTVTVGNFPAVQEVMGTVTVANAGQPAPFQLVGFTAATFDGDEGILGFTLACQAEFPGSRMCNSAEIVETVNVPDLSSSGAQSAWVRFSARPFTYRADSGISSRLLDVSGSVLDPKAADCAHGDQGGGFSTAHPGSDGFTVTTIGTFNIEICDQFLSVACCAPVPLQ